MSWKYPYIIVRYTKNAEGKWMPNGDGTCNTDLSGSKTNTQGGAVSSADALIVCPIAFGDTLAKGERLAVYYNGGKFDTFDVVKPDRNRNRNYTVYAKLNLTYRIDATTREMK